MEGQRTPGALGDFRFPPPQVRSSLFELAKKTKFHLCRHVWVTIVLLVIINLLVIFIPSMKDIFGVVGTVLQLFSSVQSYLCVTLGNGGPQQLLS